MATKGIHPDRWVAGMIADAANVVVIEGVRWISIGLFGLAGVFLIEYLIMRRSISANAKPSTPEEMPGRSTMISAKGSVTNSSIEGNGYPPDWQLLRVDGNIEGSTIKDNRATESADIQSQKHMAAQADQLNAMRDRGAGLLSTQVNTPEDFTKLLDSLTEWHMEIAQAMENLSLPAQEIYLWKTVDPLPDGHTAVIASQQQRLNKLRNIISRFLASNVSR